MSVHILADIDSMKVPGHSLDELPECFLRQLALHLPESAKLQLRLCCHQLLRIVDATGIKLSIRSTSTALALKITHHNIRSLDLTRCEGASDLLLQSCSSGCKLPSLQIIACRCDQLFILSLLALKANKLQLLKLVSPSPLSDVWSDQQLSGLSCLSTIHLDVSCHKILTAASSTPQQRPLWSLISTQTKLQSLVLQHGKPREFSIDSCVMTHSCWFELIQNLTALTRLEIGSRHVTSSSSTSTQCSAGLRPDSVSGLLSPVPNLLHLRCFGFDNNCEDTWNLA